MKQRPAAVLFIVLITMMIAFISCDSGSDRELILPTPKAPASGKIRVPEVKPPIPYTSDDPQLGIGIIREDDPEQKRLYLNIHKPREKGKFPVLLMATAYRRENMQLLSAPPVEELVSQGYAVIFMDVRGSGSSEGKWEVLSYNEIQDIVWVIDHWIPAQSWSNGKVGMFGASYMGLVQHLAAGHKPSHLKAIFPVVSTADIYRDIFYHGGIFHQEFMAPWAVGTLLMSLLPSTETLVNPTSAIQAFMEHSEAVPEVLSNLERSLDQPFFDERSPMYYWNEIAEYPVFATGGWWDIFTRGSLMNYTWLVKKAEAIEQATGVYTGPKRLIIGPWYHLNAAVGLPLDRLHKLWFDWHLKLDDDPNYQDYYLMDPEYPVTMYVFGAEQWRKEKEWPLSRAQYQTLYLSSDKQVHDEKETLNNGSLVWAEELPGGGIIPPDSPPSRIEHDPTVEEPPFAGALSRSSCRWMAGATMLLPWVEDDSENEKIILTFSSAPLDRDVEVTGPAVLRFWARSQFGPPPETPPDIWDSYARTFQVDASPLIPWARQTNVHWVVNLNDVFPGGRSRNITSGWLAASHRPDPNRPDWTQPGYDPFEYPEHRDPNLPEDGVLYEYVVEIWPMSNVFKAGHQIRVDIANSDWPHLLPSLVPSENEIVHDAQHPARLILPVVDQDSTDSEQWIDNPEAYFACEAE